MLTKRQNLLETIHGGKPDRFVKQYEAFVRPTRRRLSVNGVVFLSFLQLFVGLLRTAVSL